MSKTDTGTSFRHGADIDTDRVADYLEAYAEKLREGDAGFQGLDVDHNAEYNEWQTVEVRIRSAAHADIPLFDLPIYKEPSRGDE